MNSNWVGASYERGDGYDKACGLATYGTDVILPRMLQAKILRSPHPHARILDIDVEQARKLPGVKAVVTGRDYPDSRWGMMLADQPIYAVDCVRYAGEAVAGVAAADQDTAMEALDRIRVEFEELPPVLDTAEAMISGATLLHPDLGRYEYNQQLFSPIPGTNICNHFKLRRGDVEEGFRQSDRVFEDTFNIPMVQHCPMEPHACVAQFSPQGKLTVWSNTQGLYLTREQVAKGIEASAERRSDRRHLCRRRVRREDQRHRGSSGRGAGPEMRPSPRPPRDDAGGGIRLHICPSTRPRDL